MARGTAASFVDLHPAGFENSYINAAWGTSQVGSGYDGEPYTYGENAHALLWHGNEESVVDLHPAGFRESFAEDVVGNIQVGTGVLDGPGFQIHALLWQGSADSVVDLHPFTEQLGMPIRDSFARAVNENGEVFGEISGADFFTYAVKWTPVPEPSALTIACIAAIGIGVVARKMRRIQVTFDSNV